MLEYCVKLSYRSHLFLNLTASPQPELHLQLGLFLYLPGKDADIAFRHAEFEGDVSRRLAGTQHADDPVLERLTLAPVRKRHPEPAEGRTEPFHTLHPEDGGKRGTRNGLAGNVRGHPAYGPA